MTDPARHLQLVPEEAPDPLIGQLVDGRYRVEAVLGKGGMGLVYRARHHVLGKLVALKVLKPEVSRDVDTMERFRREAQAASAIGSPHICDVSDFGALGDGSTYFVMEFLDGPSLTQVMSEERPLADARIAKVAKQICDALGAAHARGIVHRDLKPDNVHVVPRGGERDFVKILDFGIAKVAGGADKKLTQAGQIFGTPHYMSPEQCSGRDVDQRTDVYALGVMLYEMACGKVPFDSDTLMGVLTKHVYEHPIPPHEVRADVSPGLEAVIMKCLAKRADERYATMAELRAELDRIDSGGTPSAVKEQLERAMAHAPRTVALPSIEVPRTAPEKNSGVMAIVLATLALLALAGGAFAIAFAWPSDTPRPVVQPTEVPDPPPDITPPPVDPTIHDDEPVAAAAPIALASDPPGAIVLDDSGAIVGNTPLELLRPAEGERAEYRIQLSGYIEQTITVSARSGASLTLHLVRERGRNPHRPPIVTTTTTTTTTNHVPDTSLDRDPPQDLIDPFAPNAPNAPRRP